MQELWWWEVLVPLVLCLKVVYNTSTSLAYTCNTAQSSYGWRVYNFQGTDGNCTYYMEANHPEEHCAGNNGNYMKSHDIIMGAMTPQITGVSIVYSTVCSGAYQRKHQSSASLAFERGIHRSSVNSPHKGPVTENVSIWWRHHDGIASAWLAFVRAIHRS